MKGDFDGFKPSEVLDLLLDEDDSLQCAAANPFPDLADQETVPSQPQQMEETEDLLEGSAGPVVEEEVMMEGGVI